ncbi:hypothetical protein PR048_002976 [Dryococelus australis]|uniref:Uncharacterized protein n=1 Tax=Dryococelus australis TaxID=614101 RepID=A0ABQ9ILT4_9NEOP|nr:hypothetical protein PR048_002976 [Dryococelus australis]
MRIHKTSPGAQENVKVLQEKGGVASNFRFHDFCFASSREIVTSCGWDEILPVGVCMGRPTERGYADLHCTRGKMASDKGTSLTWKETSFVVEDISNNLVNSCYQQHHLIPAYERAMYWTRTLPDISFVRCKRLKFYVYKNPTGPGPLSIAHPPPLLAGQSVCQNIPRARSLPGNARRRYSVTVVVLTRTIHNSLHSLLSSTELRERAWHVRKLSLSRRASTAGSRPWGEIWTALTNAIRMEPYGAAPVSKGGGGTGDPKENLPISGIVGGEQSNHYTTVVRGNKSTPRKPTNQVYRPPCSPRTGTWLWSRREANPVRLDGRGGGGVNPPGGNIRQLHRPQGRVDTSGLLCTAPVVHINYGQRVHGLENGAPLFPVALHESLEGSPPFPGVTLLGAPQFPLERILPPEYLSGNTCQSSLASADNRDNSIILFTTLGQPQYITLTLIPENTNLFNSRQNRSQQLRTEQESQRHWRNVGIPRPTSLQWYNDVLSTFFSCIHHEGVLPSLPGGRIRLGVEFARYTGVLCASFERVAISARTRRTFVRRQRVSATPGVPMACGEKLQERDRQRNGTGYENYVYGIKLHSGVSELKREKLVHVKMNSENYFSSDPVGLE